jgi:hypothetical protein
MGTRTALALAALASIAAPARAQDSAIIGSADLLAGPAPGAAARPSGGMPAAGMPPGQQHGTGGAPGGILAGPVPWVQPGQGTAWPAANVPQQQPSGGAGTGGAPAGGAQGTGPFVRGGVIIAGPATEVGRTGIILATPSAPPQAGQGTGNPWSGQGGSPGPAPPSGPSGSGGRWSWAQASAGSWNWSWQQGASGGPSTGHLGPGAAGQGSWQAQGTTGQAGVQGQPTNASPWRAGGSFAGRGR